MGSNYFYFRAEWLKQLLYIFCVSNLQKKTLGYNWPRSVLSLENYIAFFILDIAVLRFDASLIIPVLHIKKQWLWIYKKLSSSLLHSEIWYDVF